MALAARRSSATSVEAGLPVVRQYSLLSGLAWLNGFIVSSIPLINFSKSPLSLLMRVGLSSWDTSSLAVSPAMPLRLFTTAALIGRVMFHLLRAPTLCVNAVMPVCLDAASLLTVCSSVKSTAQRENDFAVRLIDNAPFSNVARIPAWVPNHPNKG